MLLLRCALKAARLHNGQTALKLDDVPEPTVRPGSALVRIESAFVAPYYEQLISASRWPSPTRPFTLGENAVGVIEKVGDQVHGLDVGQRVYCDGFIEAVGVQNQGYCFIGAFCSGEAGLQLQSIWPDGVLAEKAVLPVECFTPIPRRVTASPSILTRLNWFSVGYGALQRGSLAAGETVLVNGATGLIGTSTVAMALAMGASQVVVVGRRQAIVEELLRFDPRIVSPDSPECPELVDVIVDCVDSKDPTSTQNAISKLGKKGRFVIVGGVDADISVHYGWFIGKESAIIGSFRYGREILSRVLNLIATGYVDLSKFRCKEFSPDLVNDAVNAAARQAGGFEHVSLTF